MLSRRMSAALGLLALVLLIAVPIAALGESSGSSYAELKLKVKAPTGDILVETPVKDDTVKVDIIVHNLKDRSAM